MSADNGGSAFPNNGAWGNGFPEQGMTLRDYFAAAALQGLCAEELHIVSMHEKSKYQQIAERAYTYANAMLRERDK